MASAQDPPITPEAPSTEELKEQEEHASRNLFRGLVSLGVLIALAVGLLLAVPGLHGVAAKVTDMNFYWLAAAVILEILSCLGYVLAFLQVFDRAPVRLGARVALTEQAFGVAVSLGGVGSAAVGALLLVERGGRPHRVAELSAVLFLLTSAVNVITLAIVGLGLWTGVLAGPSDPLLSLLPGSIGVVVLVLFLAMPRLSERYIDLQKPGRLRLIVRETSITIRETERKLFTRDWRVLGAYGYLWFDIGVLAACFAAAGRVPPLATIVLAYQIGYMVNVIPIPGNIGILDGSIVGMFVLYGVNGTLVTAATVVYHAIALWIPAMWGTIAFLILRRSRGEPLKLRPSRAERQVLRAERRLAQARRQAAKEALINEQSDTR
jgi:uncharacterized membrane protein YbhN (UPF0104 family)